MLKVNLKCPFLYIPAKATGKDEKVSFEERKGEGG